MNESCSVQHAAPASNKTGSDWLQHKKFKSQRCIYHFYETSSRQIHTYTHKHTRSAYRGCPSPLPNNMNGVANQTSYLAIVADEIPSKQNTFRVEIYLFLSLTFQNIAFVTVRECNKILSFFYTNDSCRSLLPVSVEEASCRFNLFALFFHSDDELMHLIDWCFAGVGCVFQYPCTFYAFNFEPNSILALLCCV